MKSSVTKVYVKINCCTVFAIVICFWSLMEEAAEPSPISHKEDPMKKLMPVLLSRKQEGC